MLLVILGALAAMALSLMLLGRAVGIVVSTRLAWTLVGIGIAVSLLTMMSGPWALWRKLLALGTASAVPRVAIPGAAQRAGGRPILASLRTPWGAAGVFLARGGLVGAVVSGLG